MKKVSALVGAIALTLLTSSAWAQQMSGDYELTVPGGERPVLGVVLKSERRDCPSGTTFFKNKFPSLTNGQGGGNKTEIYSIDNVDVTMTVEWSGDNYFEFSMLNGVAHKVGVNIDTINLLYNYETAPVSGDARLNKLENDQPAADVNHLDLCLAVAVLDTVPPVIEFISPLDGEQVSGTDYPVQVTVYDPSGVDEDTVTFNIDGDSFPMTCEATDQSGTEYICSYIWNTEEYETGFYELTATATDLVGNTGTAPVPPIEVEVVRLYTQCFGTIGTEDFEDIIEPDLPGGCDPTGAVLIQTPPNGSVCDVGPGEPIPDICYIAGTLLKPANPTDRCGIYGFPDSRTAPMGVNGEYMPFDPRPLYVFDPSEAGIDPAQSAGVVAEIRAAYPDGAQGRTDQQLLKEAVVLDENTFCANGCCLIAQHTKGDLLDGLYLNWDTENGTVFVKVHKAREQFAKEGKADLATTCYNDSNLQKSFNAGYEPLFQTDDDTGVLTVLTQECQNPARTLSRGNGFDVSNIIVNDATIPDDATPTVWLEFRLQKIQEDFDRVFFLFSLIDRDGLLLTGNFNRDVQNPVKEAQRKFRSNNIASKDQAIAALMEAADGIRTKTTYRITEANPPGEALSLIEHLIYDLGVTRDEQATIQ